MRIFPISYTDLATQKYRMHANKSAQAEMISIVAERRLLTALTRDIPPTADRNNTIAEEVLAYSENNKEWLGPIIVVDYTCLMVTAYNRNTELRQTDDTFQVKSYFRTINMYLVDLQFNSGVGQRPVIIQLTT